MEYTIGITDYDEWKVLWGTEVGMDKEGQLYFTVWAETAERSRYAAAAFIDLMNENLKDFRALP